MLTALIIEQVKRREREKAYQKERPFLEVPRPHPDDERRQERNGGFQKQNNNDETAPRGVIVIQL